MLDSDPGLSLSLSERLEAFRRWETALAEADLREPDARIDASILAGGSHSVEIYYEQYFVVICEGYGEPAGYSFLDVHSSHANVSLWTTIQFDTRNVLVFALPRSSVLRTSCVNQSLTSSPRFSLHLRFTQIRDSYGT
jgi:hypothetical protein